MWAASAAMLPRQKLFETQYYTAGIHEGALQLPPFMKKALG
jgi:spermidine synthase